MLTSSQKMTVNAIVNVFETGSVTGDYGNVTVIEKDTGHLTFGRSQTTLMSGNLASLIDKYCSNPGSQFGHLLQPYLDRLRRKDISLDNDKLLHNILRSTADDPVMRGMQDIFFDEVYFQPAMARAKKVGLLTPLGIAIVYDSTVHGSWDAVCGIVNAKYGACGDIGEKKWLLVYVSERRNWLATHSNEVLHSTVYRMDSFLRLIDFDEWGLVLPLVVRGQEISLDTLQARPCTSFDGPQPGSRSLSLCSPLLKGLDVRLVQLRLSMLGFDVVADGIFGKNTANAVSKYQVHEGRPASGVADCELVVGLVSALFADA